MGVSLLILVFLASFTSTYFVRIYAIKKSILDTPNQRSSHSVPTPRGGGLAIVISWFAILLWLFLKKEIDSNLFYALISGSVLAIISLLDDVFTLSPKVRIIAQAVSAGMAIFFIHGSFILDFGLFAIDYWWLFIPLAFIGLIWFINLYNFLDGIDGYSASQAIFVSLTFVLFTQDNLLLFLVAAILGFLVWNWQPSKIFMGDVGSTALGFILGVFTVYYSQVKNISIFTLLIPSALFWYDATYTLYRRWRNKEKLSEAHKKHAYQRMVLSGWSHQKTVLWALAVNIPILGFFWISIRNPDLSLLLFVINIAYLNMMMRVVDKRYPFNI